MNTTRFALTDDGMNAPAVVLNIDGLDLMFRQSDIRALESASDVDASDPGGKRIGWISYMRQRWPVYCLSGQLGLLGKMPPARRTCALLEFENGYFAILCDDVTIIKQVAGQHHEVPIVMKHADTPILELIPCGDRLLCVSNPSRLAAYLEHLVHLPSLPEGLPCPA